MECAHRCPPEKDTWVWVVKTRVATGSIIRAWRNRDAWHCSERSGGVVMLPTRSMQTRCRASATDYVRVLRVGNAVTEARLGATAQREAGVARCYMVRRQIGRASCRERV